MARAGYFGNPPHIMPRAPTEIAGSAEKSGVGRRAPRITHHADAARAMPARATTQTDPPCRWFCAYGWGALTCRSRLLFRKPVERGKIRILAAGSELYPYQQTRTQKTLLRSTLAANPHHGGR